MHQTHRWTC